VRRTVCRDEPNRLAAGVDPLDLDAVPATGHGHRARAPALGLAGRQLQAREPVEERPEETADVRGEGAGASLLGKDLRATSTAYGCGFGPGTRHSRQRRVRGSVVWLTDFGANAIVRFDPRTSSFRVIRTPTPDAAVRQLLGRRGELWGAESGADKLLVVRTG
jgi:hypothetical protein